MVRTAIRNLIRKIWRKNRQKKWQSIGVFVTYVYQTCYNSLRLWLMRLWRYIFELFHGRFDWYISTNKPLTMSQSVMPSPAVEFLQSHICPWISYVIIYIYPRVFLKTHICREIFIFLYIRIYIYIRSRLFFLYIYISIDKED